MRRRMRVRIEGIVQGVGFRPFVYLLASENTLSGFVFNDPNGVTIEVEGEESALNRFIHDIKSRYPPLSRIENIRSDLLPPVGYEGFKISESYSGSERFTLISPDIAICPDCLRELFDPQDRRYLYPFINCTNCGPRFTIIRDVPYDRDKTTMDEFPMCPDCQYEYENPTDRRFHAQPNACRVCGPKMAIFDRSGHEIPVKDAVAYARSLLFEGLIVAVKGLGGYHLSCDAYNPEAVRNLRSRKYREDKPFALMVGDLAVVTEICRLDEDEKTLLETPARPIVLLPKKEGSRVAEEVAPGQKYLGVMLPYTPLHHILIHNMDSPLVMTSGNTSDEPIAFEDQDAFERLGNIADFFLVHNRKIHTRCDDSVARIFSGHSMMTRRSRGYVPSPIKLPFRSPRKILACGAELKNTFCLLRDEYAFFSHHIGDLENMETLTSFERGIEHFKQMFQIEPEIVAYDLHPEYLSTKYALDLDGLEKIGVQHHHAHIASCTADNGVSGEVIGVAFDGTGYGTDGNIWGGEFLVADWENFRRIAHLEYIPLPGGSMAIKEPWRMAAIYLSQIFGESFPDLDIEFVRKLDIRKWQILKDAVRLGINSPLASSVGRLFDAVSALLGIRLFVNYEGQAAVELEMAADESCYDRYGYFIDKSCDPMIVSFNETFSSIIEDIRKNIPIGTISARFHNTIAYVIVDVCSQIRDATGLDDVALSGGVFQNMLLLGRATSLLSQRGFRVLTQSQVPTNDGGIALGQVVIAACKTGGGYLIEKSSKQ